MWGAGGRGGGALLDGTGWIIYTVSHCRTGRPHKRGGEGVGGSK